MRRENQQHAADPADASPLDGQFKVVGDQLGSTTLVVGVDHQGNTEVVQREYYKPYGEVAYEYKAWHQGQEHRNIPTTFGYTGQRLDKEESGLMYYGARYYDPALGYFVSADPTVPNPASSPDHNRYLYVRGNPLRFIDPSGYTPADYYVFVNGCAPGSIGGGSGCGNPDWGEYLGLLHQQYARWRTTYRRLAEEDPDMGRDWTDWSREHVKFLYATTPSSGADEIEAYVASKAGKGGGFHLLGHSRGGAAILEYLNRVRHYRERAAKDYGPIPTTSERRGLLAPIKSATMIDAEELVPWEQPGPGFGEWAASQGIQILDVDTKKDWVHHGKIPGVGHPEGHYYGGPPDPPPFRDWDNAPLDDNRRHTWHDYTSAHMATETRDFLDRVWP